MEVDGQVHAQALHRRENIDR